MKFLEDSLCLQPLKDFDTKSLVGVVRFPLCWGCYSFKTSPLNLSCSADRANAAGSLVVTMGCRQFLGVCRTLLHKHLRPQNNLVCTDQCCSVVCFSFLIWHVYRIILMYDSSTDFRSIGIKLSSKVALMRIRCYKKVQTSPCLMSPECVGL